MMMSFWVFTTALGYHFWSLVMEVSSQHKLYRCLVLFVFDGTWIFEIEYWKDACLHKCTNIKANDLSEE